MMNISISQLRALVAVCDCNLNITAAAKLLATTQSSISKKIIRLEEELGVPLFYRNGKHLQYETDACHRLLSQARLVLASYDDLYLMSRSTQQQKEVTGELNIGTTHTQARYTLPLILAKFQEDYPRVNLNIYQDKPSELVALLGRGNIDFAICTEALETNNNFKTILTYSWNRLLVVRADHPLAKLNRPITLKMLAGEQLVTYSAGFTGRKAFEEVFRANDLQPHFRISTSDTDVIKTYVRLGFGVGVITDLAYEKEKDKDLCVHSLAHLFPQMHVRLAYQQNRYLTTVMQRFIELFTQFSKKHSGRTQI